MPAPQPPSVVSMKGVVIADVRVLLARNHRDEWELPGGRPEPGESPATTVVREVAEEAAMAVKVLRQVHVEDFEVMPGRWVKIKAFACRPEGGRAIAPSDEHVALAWFPADALPDDLPDVYRRAIEAALTSYP